MSAITTFDTIFIDNERRAEESINRKIFRDCSNPFDVPELVFVSSYGLNKSAFCMLLNFITTHIKGTSLTSQLLLAAAQRFLAEGSFQNVIGKNSFGCVQKCIKLKHPSHLFLNYNWWKCPYLRN